LKKDLESLTETTRAKAIKALELCKSANIPVAVTSTRRTDDEQIALYAQGRLGLLAVNTLRRKAGLYQLAESENTYTVTNCDGVKSKSKHQAGLALDVVPTKNGAPIWPDITDIRWKQISDIFIGVGFTWGGTWGDAPHYELPA